MKRASGIVALSLALACTAFAADDFPLGKIVDVDIKMIEREVVPLAEAMPADKYEFVPTSGEFKGARTFALQMKHIAAVNYAVAAAALQETAPMELGADENGPASIKGKDAIVKFLKDSFAYAHKAAAAVTDANAKDPVKSPFGEGVVARVWALSVVVWHSYDHYGQAVVYARMNGIIPPASQPQN